MKLFIHAIVFSLFCGAVYGQPVIEWQRCLGGTSADKAQSIFQAADSGYVITGQTSSNDINVTNNHGQIDFWVTRVNAAGILQWQQCFGGSSSDVARASQQTSDGGIIVAGKTQSLDGNVTGNHGFSDFWLVKLDALGNLQWQKCYGGISVDECRAVSQTPDGGYIAAGLTVSNDGDVSGNHGGSDMWIVKTDMTGNLQWQKCLGGTGNEEAYGVIPTSDGGYIAAGNTGSSNGDVTGNHGSTDVWIVKLDSSGNIQWQKCFGGTGAESAASVIQTADGGYAAIGITNSNNGDVSGNHGGLSDYWIIKFDAAGILTWQKCLGGTLDDQGTTILQTSDGGFIAAGYSNSVNGDVTNNHGLYDQWIVKLNSSGAIQWQKCFGGIGSEDCFALCINNESEYVTAGSSDLSNGDVSGNNGQADFWIVKTGFTTALIEDKNGFDSVKVFPNPSDGLFHVTISEEKFTDRTIEVYDVFGKAVETLQNKNSDSTVLINLSKHQKGVYFIKVIQGAKTSIHKIFYM